MDGADGVHGAPGAKGRNEGENGERGKRNFCESTLTSKGRDGAPGMHGENGRTGQNATPIVSTFIAHSAVEADGKILLSLNGQPAIVR